MGILKIFYVSGIFRYFFRFRGYFANFRFRELKYFGHFLGFGGHLVIF